MVTPSKIELPCRADRLLIHRPPMLLIDELTEREGKRASATASLSHDNLCIDPERGILPEYFIEIMAQTMAAANGYDGALSGSSPKNGFIVGLDKFLVHEFPKNIGVFNVQIEKTMEFAAMKVMAGEVMLEGKLIVSAEMKVWEQDSEGQ